jgi:hypothetical protein
VVPHQTVSGGLLATFPLISLEHFQYLSNHPVSTARRLRLDGSRSVYDVEVFVSTLDTTRELPSSCYCDRFYLDIHERLAYDRKLHQESDIFVNGRFANSPLFKISEIPALLRDPREEFLLGLRARGMALDLDAANRA